MTEDESKVKKSLRKPWHFEKGNNLSPGRPKGSQNKFSQLKREFAELFESEGGMELFRDFIQTKDRKERLEILKIVTGLFPKEDKIVHEDRVLNLTINRTIKDTVCPHCNTTFNIEPKKIEPL